MDTRSKILTLDAARRVAPPVALAAGYFDVPRAEHVRALRGIRERNAGCRLVVAVLPLSGALLEQRARAELAAAFRMVDYVVIADPGEVDALVECLRPVEVARLEAADARLIRQLKEHVRDRHNR